MPAAAPAKKPTREFRTQPVDAATERLLAENNALVRGLAGRLHARLPQGCGIEISDLIQAGNMGLLKCAQSFNLLRGANFTGYAKFRIRGEMLDLVRRNSERDGAGLVSVVTMLEGQEIETQCAAPAEASPENTAENEQRAAIIREEIGRLPARYRSVVELRYSRGLTLREIGDALKVNESRACQMNQDALARLKKALKRRGVTDFSQL